MCIHGNWTDVDCKFSFLFKESIVIDTDKLIDGLEIELPCPKCGHKLKQTFGRIKANKNATCVSCSTVFVIDSTQVDRLRRKLASENAKLTKAIKQLGSLGK